MGNLFLDEVNRADSQKGSLNATAVSSGAGCLSENKMNNLKDGEGHL